MICTMEKVFNKSQQPMKHKDPRYLIQTLPHPQVFKDKLLSSFECSLQCRPEGVTQVQGRALPQI